MCHLVSSNFWRYLWFINFVLSFLLSGLGTIVVLGSLVGLFGYVVIAASRFSSAGGVVDVRERETLLSQQLDPFFIGQCDYSLQEDSHIIQVYAPPCNDLVVDDNPVDVTEQIINLVRNRYVLPVSINDRNISYFLEGSKIEFHFVVSSHHISKVVIFRNYTLFLAYINNLLQAEYSSSLSFPTTNSNATNITITVNETGFYYFALEMSSAAVSVWYRVSGTVKYYDHQQYNDSHVCTLHSLLNSKRNCTVQVSSGQAIETSIGKTVCILTYAEPFFGAEQTMSPLSLGYQLRTATSNVVFVIFYFLLGFSVLCCLMTACIYCCITSWDCN